MGRKIENHQLTVPPIYTLGHSCMRPISGGTRSLGPWGVTLQPTDLPGPGTSAQVLTILTNHLRYYRKLSLVVSSSSTFLSSVGWVSVSLLQTYTKSPPQGLTLQEGVLFLALPCTSPQSLPLLGLSLWKLWGWTRGNASPGWRGSFGRAAPVIIGPRGNNSCSSSFFSLAG